MNSPRNRSTQNESDKRERDPAVGGAGDLSGLLERLLGRRAVPHIALEIDDLGRLDQGLLDVRRREIGARAEVGVHGPLAVGRHIDEAAPRARPVLGGRGRERDAGRANVVGEGRAERIALHLADIGGGDAERGDADDGVGGRAAGDHPRIDAGGVERLGAVLVDEVHRALQHLLGAEIIVVGIGEKVDQRIAQPQNLDRLAHRLSRIVSPAVPSHWRKTRSTAWGIAAGPHFPDRPRLVRGGFPARCQQGGIG